MNSARSKQSSSSSSEGDQSADDIWDDSLIIKNYDDSIAMVKEEVAKRLAMKTNKKMQPKTTKSASATAGSQEQQQKQKENHPKAEPGATLNGGEEWGESSGLEGSSSAEKGASETDNKPAFSVGDYCRATYEDGVDYEAKILAVDKAGGEVLIRYVGYNNEQTVAVEDLVPSWGRKARRKQREDAAELAAEEDKARMEVSDDEVKLTQKASKIRINYDPNFRMAASASRAGTSAATTQTKAAAGFAAGMMGAVGGGASFMVPPPPPMPPMLEDEDELESENLSAMLMSWYMSGYYTGLYHGQKMSQKRARSS